MSDDDTTRHDRDPDRGLAKATTLYRFYGANDDLIYVGISVSMFDRLTGHRYAPWWPDVTRATFQTYPTRVAALEAEGRAIIAEKPLYNRTHGNVTPEAEAKAHRLSVQHRWDERRRTIEARPRVRENALEDATKAIGRKAIGIEIEERYCEIAAQRCSQEVLGLSA